MENSCFISLYSLILISLLHQGSCTTNQNVCPDQSSRWQDLGGDYCYIIETEQTFTYLEAVQNCFSAGGSLASFHSAEETQRLVDNANDGRSRFYIGLWKHNEGPFQWVDNSALDFINWYPGRPRSSGSCAEMYINSGKWGNVDCSVRYGYICSSTKRPRVIAPKRIACPENSTAWNDFGGDMCYFIERNYKTTWGGALNRCSSLGGSLASFHTIGEIRAVIQRTQNYGSFLHIGLHQNDEGQYEWSDGSPVDLNYWKSGEPNNAWKKCVEMNTFNGLWYDSACGSFSGYVCSVRKVNICGENIESESGTIYSPNYPEYYGPNEQCTWKITVPDDGPVVLQFLALRVEHSTDCQYDYVQIRDGHESDSPVLGKFCGSAVPEVIRSSTNKISVKFASDRSLGGRGFLANFSKA